MAAWSKQRCLHWRRAERQPYNTLGGGERERLGNCTAANANCAGYARKVIITKTVRPLSHGSSQAEGRRAASPSARHWLAEPQFQGGAIGRHFTSRVDVGMRVDQRQPPWLYERQNPSMGRACGCSCLKPRLWKGRSLCRSSQAWRRSQLFTTVSSVWTFPPV